MSLYPEDDRRRGHSRTRSRDRRSARDDDAREPSYIYPEDDLDDRYRSGRHGDASMSGGSGLPYPAEGGMDQLLPGGSSLYGYDASQPIRRAPSPAANSRYRESREEQLPGTFPEDDDEDPRKSKSSRNRRDENETRPLDNNKLKHLPQKYSSKYDEGDSRRRGKYDDEDRDRRERREQDDDRLKFLPQKYSSKYDDRENEKRDKRDRRDTADNDNKLNFLPAKYSNRLNESDAEKSERRRQKKDQEEADLAYGKPAGSPRSPGPESASKTYGSYLPPSTTDNRRPSQYGDEADRRRPASPSVDEYGRRRDDRRDDPRGSRTDVLTVDPGNRERDRSRDRRRDASPNPATLTVEPRDRERSRDRRSGRDKSPQPPTARMSNLTVDTGRSSNMSLALAPGSPLLESYQGTYQDMSPMPSPLLLASHPHDMEPLSPLGSDMEDGKKRSRRARFHDAEDDATRLARALRGEDRPDTEPLIEILPGLTHEQVMDLREEYKTLVKTGSARKGVNIAKHIRARLKDEDPNLMKACYSVALGMWEGEAYWANFWYQGDKTRRELLIESLMGRTNEEVRLIKDAFTDKKYDNSLTKCMKMELKEDKFKKAVLMVLEERRMEEFDPYGRRLPIDYKLVDEDVGELRKSVKSEKGGESAMISIIVQRSESHLRAILREYEHHYRVNFAREALKKSGNLVGELLAHILNGVINRPVRDALLVHHAVSASRKDTLKHELLTSRLVRLHWDAAHMRAVRKAYKERYGRELIDAVREASSGRWGMFCEELCIARVPNDVRKFEKVAHH